MWKRHFFLLFLSLLCVSRIHGDDESDDNDFEEFDDEEFENSPEKNEHLSVPETSEGHEDVQFDEEDEAVVEDEDGDFEHFQDDEEFEGFNSDHVGGGKSGKQDPPKITIAKVPLHLRTNWESFYLEILMITGIVVYFINFFHGRSKNQRLANTWMTAHRSLLEQNFSLVGDDKKVETENHCLLKESESMYTLWCSGRTCCEGMLVELKFLKRQDLVAVMSNMLRPTLDQIQLSITMNNEDMDAFVFCIANKKTAVRLSKEMEDLSTYCPERRSCDRLGAPSSFAMMNELSEASTAMLDGKVLQVLNKYTEFIDFIHISDQYSGAKQSDDTQMEKLPERKKMLIFSFNIPKPRTTLETMEQMKPLLQLVFYCMDKVRRFRLSKDGKLKSDKNRLRVEDAFLKVHMAAQAEKAATKREDQRRQEKEKILQEDDPEKQRRWEEKEHRRQMKKKQPKMKQLKVKVM